MCFDEDLAPPSCFREDDWVETGGGFGGRGERWAMGTEDLRDRRAKEALAMAEEEDYGSPPTDTNLAIAVLYGTAQERAAAMGDSRVRDLAEKGPADKRIYLPGDAELLMAVRAADAAVCDAAAHAAAAECAE